LCVCWVPKILTNHHKTKRLGSALKFLTHSTQEGDEFMDSNCYWRWNLGFSSRCESKQLSLQWRHMQSPWTKKFRTSISVKKSWCPFSGTENAFSWLTSYLLTQELILLHTVTPWPSFDKPFNAQGGECCHVACTWPTATHGPIPRTSPLRFCKNSSGMYWVTCHIIQTSHPVISTCSSPKETSCWENWEKVWWWWWRARRSHDVIQRTGSRILWPGYTEAGSKT
jgi:hypothetical protein